MLHLYHTSIPIRSHRFLLLMPVLILALLLSGISIQAQQGPQPLTLDGRAPGDGFGRGVAIDGDTALVEAGDGIYVFVRSGTTWTQQTKLVADDGTPLHAGAVNVDTAAGYNDTANTPGAVVVFVRSGTTWTQQAKLTIDQNVYPETQVVGPVVIQGNQLLVGVLDRSVNGDKPDLRIFSYVRSGTTWSLETDFYYNDDQGSHSLAADGSYAVVYSEDAGMGYDPDGSFSVYQHSGSVWNGVASAFFLDGDPDVPDSNGAVQFNADISGNTIASGGYIYDYNEDGTIHSLYDVVFVFTLSGSTLTRQALLKPTNNLGHHYYIDQVGLEGNNLLVTVQDPDTGTYLVLYYLRSGSTWTLQSSPVTTYTDNLYGHRPMELSGNTLLIGAESENAAYVYVLSGTTWSQQAKLTLTPDAAELLVNGGFETAGNGSTSAYGWKFSTQAGIVERDCFDPAYEGFCSLSFRYGSAKAVQNVDLNTHNLKAGDKIRLTGFYYKETSADYPADVWLYVSYATLPDQQAHISVQRATSGWQAFPKLSATLKAKPTRVRVVIKASVYYDFSIHSYRYVYFDDLSLKLITPEFKLAKKAAKQAGQSELLPLPENVPSSLTHR